MAGADKTNGPEKLVPQSNDKFYEHCKHVLCSEMHPKFVLFYNRYGRMVPYVLNMACQEVSMDLHPIWPSCILQFIYFYKYALQRLFSGSLVNSFRSCPGCAEAVEGYLIIYKIVSLVLPMSSQ